MEDERYVVISADMHAGSDVLGYRPYLAARWRDEFDAWSKTVSSRWHATPDNEESSETMRCRWDSDLRLRQLEADGICAELVFPDTLPPFFPSSAVFANQPRIALITNDASRASRPTTVGWWTSVPQYRAVVRVPCRFSCTTSKTPSPKFDGAMTLGCPLYSYQRWRLITR